MISVVIPALNAAERLPRALEALIPAAIRGLVREVIVVDGGSTDATRTIADAAGARIIEAPRGRGVQLVAGAEAARCRWLLFLHADTVLAPGWEDEAQQFMSGGEGRAGAFRFRLDDDSTAARILETIVAWRCRTFRLPYGDQGLLIPAALYREIGGFRPLPLMEDVEIVRTLGRRRLHMLASPAVTSAERYRREGYALRPLRNSLIVTLYFLGVAPERLARLYGYKK